MKKILTFILTVIMTISAMQVFYIGASAEETDTGDYAIKIIDDATAEITKYSGSDKQITVPQEIDGHTIVSIGKKAFRDNDSVRRITLPQTVTQIGNEAFAYCVFLNEFTMPSGLKEIPHRMFRGCTSLQTVTLNDGLKNIGEYAFDRCSELTAIVIPDTVEKVEKGAFSGCDLNKIDFGKGLKEIGARAFVSSNVKEVTLPDSLETLRAYAFGNSLERINFGKNANKISNSAFEMSEKLRTIKVSSKNKTYKTKGGVLFNKAMTKLITYPQGKTEKSYVVPDTVKSIGSWAFCENQNIKKLVLSKNLTKICDNAISECKNLRTLKLSNKIKTIGDHAVSYCNIESITIPKSVTSIGKQAFDFSRIKNLIINANSNLKIGSEAFSCNNINTLVYPKFKSGGTMFSFCQKLKKLTIDNNVTEIGEYEFYSCDKLKTVIIPSNVKKIGKYAFGYYDDGYGSEEKIKDFIIKGKANSAAEKYATKNKFKFIKI